MNETLNETPTTTVTPEILALANKVSTNMNGCRFASFTYKTKKTGEVARYVVLIGFSYIEMVKDSIEELTAKMEGLTGLELEAANEVMASLRETLEKHAVGEQNSAYTKAGMYSKVRGGVNINLNDNSIQVFGRKISKVVLVPGVHKKVNSKPLTIAKNKIKRDLSVSSFREYAFDENVILSGKVNGETFECVTPECMGFVLNEPVTVNEADEVLA